MRISQEDVIFAKGLGVALDAPEDGCQPGEVAEALDDHVWRAAPAEARCGS